MRIGFTLAVAIALAGCGSRTGGDNAIVPAGAPGGLAVEEDRQVLIDLAKRACTERADLQPNVETAVAQRGCDCAIDRLYTGKSADQMMEARRQPGGEALEDRTAKQCLGESR